MVKATISAPAAAVPVTLDANEAVASVVYRLNEIFSIYPITPSSPMADHCDEWAAEPFSAPVCRKMWLHGSGFACRAVNS